MENDNALLPALTIESKALTLPDGNAPAVFESLAQAIATVRAMIALPKGNTANRETRIYAGVALKLAGEYSSSSIIVGLEEFQYDAMVTATINAMAGADTKSEKRKICQTQVSRAMRLLRDSDVGDEFVWPASKEKKIIAPSVKLIRAWLDAATIENCNALLDLIPNAVALATDRAAKASAARDAEREEVLASLTDGQRKALGL